MYGIFRYKCDQHLWWVDMEAAESLRKLDTNLTRCRPRAVVYSLWRIFSSELLQSSSFQICWSFLIQMSTPNHPLVITIESGSFFFNLAEGIKSDLTSEPPARLIRYCVHMFSWGSASHCVILEELLLSRQPFLQESLFYHSYYYIISMVIMQKRIASPESFNTLFETFGENLSLK